LNVIGIPEHPLVKGVTIMELLKILSELLRDVNEGILSFPAPAGIPVRLLVATQLYCVLIILEPVNLIAFVAFPAHKI
jgi:hypothetical protein